MSKRRTFLIGAAAAAAGSTRAGTASAQQDDRIDPRKPFKRKSRFKSEMVTIGMVGSWGGGHTSGIWGQNWNPDDAHIRTTGMNCQYVWCLRPEEMKQYGDKYGFEPMKNPEDMIGKIDGVFIDDFFAVPVLHLMAKPFLEAGIPTFVQRPGATSMEKIRALTSCADTNKTPLMVGSTWEFAESCGDVRQSLKSVQEIKGYVSHTSFGSYYAYGPHGIYYIYACLKDWIRGGKGPAVAASYLTNDWIKPGGCVTFEHSTPGGSYYGSFHMPYLANANSFIRVFCNRPFDVEGKIPASPGYFTYNTWNAMQLAIQEMFEKKISPEDSTDIIEKTAMFLMGFKSLLDRKGAPVRREEMEGWELMPLPKEYIPTTYSVDELKQLARVFGGEYTEPKRGS
jgi:hypothetical protein